MIKLAVYYHSESSKNSAKKKKKKVPEKSSQICQMALWSTKLPFWITDIPKNIMKHSDKTLDQLLHFRKYNGSTLRRKILLYTMIRTIYLNVYTIYSPSVFEILMD